MQTDEVEHLRKIRETIGFFRQLRHAYEGRPRHRTDVPVRAPMMPVIRDFIERAEFFLDGGGSVRRYIQQLASDLSTTTLTGSRAWRSGSYIARALGDAYPAWAYVHKVYVKGQPGYNAMIISGQLRELENNHYDPAMDQESVDPIDCEHVSEQLSGARRLLDLGHPLIPLVVELARAATQPGLTWGLLQEDAGLIAQGLEDRFTLTPGGGVRTTYPLRDNKTTRVTVMLGEELGHARQKPVPLEY